MEEGAIRLRGADLLTGRGPGGAAALVAAGLVIAQAAPASSGDYTAAEIKKAKFHMGLGADFFRAGRHAEALAEMRKAHEVAPLPALVFNMARCYQEMGRHAEAVEYFQRYMEEGDEEKKLQATQAALAELIPKAFGALEVTCEPASAAVRIVGVGAGPCPFVKEQVPAGSWRMEVSAEGYGPHSEEVEVVASQRRAVTVRLLRPGRLNVTSNPPGAQAQVDGRPVGRTPIEALELPEGEHTLALTLAAHRDLVRPVRVPPGEAVTVAADLERRGGRVKVTSNPDGATVLVDGRAVGSTPLATLALDEGEHALRVEAGLHVPWARHVRIEDAGAIELHADLPSRLPAWSLATAAALAAVGAGSALLLARGAYADRDDVLADYNLSASPAESGRLADEVRARESDGDAMLLASRALLGAAVAAAGGAGWLFATMPGQAGGP